MRLPIWFKQKVPSGPVFGKVVSALQRRGLNTVCDEALCPNRSRCFSSGTLTFQILGKICTRNCGFCGEKQGSRAYGKDRGAQSRHRRGKPLPPDGDEPFNVARAACDLKLKHVVVTAPARDDLPDGGAPAFAGTVSAIRNLNSQATVEVLVGDFKGNSAALRTVFESRPDVFNHNLETVRRLTPRVRSGAFYDRSLEILKAASRFGLRVKSGLMVGLGEEESEVFESLGDLRDAGVDFLTVGQYLRPSPGNLPVVEYYAIEQFDEIRRRAIAMGFKQAFCGPLVRSSYRAYEMLIPGTRTLKNLEL